VKNILLICRNSNELFVELAWLIKFSCTIKCEVRNETALTKQQPIILEQACN